MFLLLFIIIAVIVLTNKEYVLAIYFTITFMFPGFVRIYPIPVSLQLVFTFFLFIFTFYINKHKILFSKDNIYCTSFLVYQIGSRILFAFLGTYMTFSEQLNLNATLMLIIFLLCCLHTGKKQFEKLRDIFPYVLFLFMTYGILTSITSTNPYFEFISKFMGGDSDYLSIANRYTSEVRGGLIGRISVVTYSPLLYAILIDILFYLVLYFYLEKKEKKYLILMGLMFFNVFLAGSRGPLVALIVPIILFLFIKMEIRQKIIMVSSIIIIMFLVFTLPFLENYSSYIKSFIFIFDESYSDAANIRGSSVSGRFEQLYGSIDLIFSSLDIKTILFGYGQGYTSYYLKTFGYSTEVLGFESAIFVILVNHGIMGLLVFFFGKFIFLFTILHILYKNNKLDENCHFVLKSYLFTNLIYSVLVGPVHEDLFYVVFFVLLKYTIIHKKENMIKQIYLLSKYHTINNNGIIK